MKREGLRHPKTLDLMSRLSINRREAIGLLDLLLDWAMDYAPCGDIGKWSNGVIAGAVEWTGNADDLVNALVGSGWLDENDLHRLVIHDWPDHAPTFHRAKLKKLGLEFLKCYESSGIAPDGSAEPSSEPTTPLLSSPLLKPNQTAAAAAAQQLGNGKTAAAAAEVVTSEEWKKAIPHAKAIREKLRPRDQRLTDSEREWAAKIAVLTLRRGEAWLNTALEGFRGGVKIAEPKAYIHSVLDGELYENHKQRLNSLLARIKLPEEFYAPNQKASQQA